MLPVPTRLWKLLCIYWWINWIELNIINRYLYSCLQVDVNMFLLLFTIQVPPKTDLIVQGLRCKYIVYGYLSVTCFSVEFQHLIHCMNNDYD